MVRAHTHTPKHTHTQTHRHTHSLTQSVSLDQSQLRLPGLTVSVGAHACQSEYAEYLCGPACVTLCLHICVCARLRWLILWSGETGPDGAWRLAVFVVTELMMLFMKFIDPICITPRVPSPILLSVSLPLTQCMLGCSPVPVNVNMNKNAKENEGTDVKS